MFLIGTKSVKKYLLKFCSYSLFQFSGNTMSCIFNLSKGYYFSQNIAISQKLQVYFYKIIIIIILGHYNNDILMKSNRYSFKL